MSYSVRIDTNDYAPDGTPIVHGHTVNGTAFEDGRPLPNAFIEIIELEINDEGSGYSGPDGKFSIRVGEDTSHHVFVNHEDVLTIKIITP